jgi:NNP family nitrate/nitrite transporter-like MFS transporter
VLAIYAAVSAVLLRDAPNRSTSPGSFLQRTWAAARLPVTGQLAILYAVGFGGFVAFSVYLPTYLRNAFDLTQNDAALRTAGFVILAVAMRPVGGWLSDRVDPAVVLASCFILAAVLAAVTTFELPLIPVGTIAFLGLAAMLGAASGACFALVGRRAPAAQVGSVTGLVGAAGGLGGFVPPLIMGVLYGRTGDYSIGLGLLAVVALASAVYTWFVVRRPSAPLQPNLETAPSTQRTARDDR